MRIKVKGLDKSLSKLGRALGKNGSKILIAMGIAGFTAAVGMAITATPKASMDIEEEKYNTNKEKLTPAETVKVAWKHYIPTAITMAMSTACIIGGSKLDSKQSAALATAYTVATQTLNDYKEKLPEIVGEEKVNEVEKAVTQTQISRAPAISDERTPISPDELPIYDQWSGRVFWITLNELDRAINAINKNMLSEGTTSLSDLYYELGKNETKTSDDLGWNMYKDGLVELIKNDSGVMDDGRPCLLLSFSRPPHYGYWQ